jgi:hypothetical protein
MTLDLLPNLQRVVVEVTNHSFANRIRGYMETMVECIREDFKRDLEVSCGLEPLADI